MASKRLVPTALRDSEQGRDARATKAGVLRGRGYTQACTLQRSPPWGSRDHRPLAEGGALGVMGSAVQTQQIHPQAEPGRWVPGPYTSHLLKGGPYSRPVPTSHPMLLSNLPS